MIDNTAPTSPDPTAGWHASLDLGFAERGGRTVLAGRRQRGPLAVQRPFHPGDGACHVYLLHPPGGVVGGDTLAVTAAAQAGSRALITTPGATKFYRSAGAEARVEQTLSVADGGVLEWLPQENIFFPGARVRLDTRVGLSGSARFIGWESVCLGRPAVDERFLHGRLSLGLRVERDAVPLLIERLRIDTEAHLDAVAGQRGHPVSATFIATPADHDDLAAARRAMVVAQGDHAAATLVDGVLVLRYLGGQAEAVRRCFVPVWQALRPRIAGLAADVPRIWMT